MYGYRIEHKGKVVYTQNNTLGNRISAVTAGRSWITKHLQQQELSIRNGREYKIIPVYSELGRIINQHDNKLLHNAQERHIQAL